MKRYVLDFNGFINESNTNKRIVVGVKETVEIKKIGRVKAKFDTGNSAMTALIVDSYNEEDGNVKFKMFGKKYEFPVVGYKKVLHTSKLDNRPYIHLDIVFNGKLYKDEKVNLKINAIHNLDIHARLLICKDFLIRAKVLIDPSNTFKVTNKVKHVKKLNENYEVLTNDNKEKLLSLDEEYHILIEDFRTKYVARECDNIKDEYNKFMNAIKENKKYYPQLSIADSKVDKNILDKMKSLNKKFEKFDCFLSQFYINRLKSMISSLEQRLKIENGDYTPGDCPVSDEDYFEALKTIKENPYKKIDYKNDRIYDAEYVKNKIEKSLQDLGYNFKVEIIDNMLPRMNVKMGYVKINKTSKFSDNDIEGLIAHEIKGHVGRRFYGEKLGLWLFAYGLQSSSTYDEGLAIWNSLNLVDTTKENIKFNIALKTCISYLMYKIDFCSLYNWVKQQAPEMSNYTAFKTVIRPKRKVKDCEIISGEPMTTYFNGYRLVNKMDNKMREDILKYNIGPDQIDILDDIKNFFEKNKFEELK